MRPFFKFTLRCLFVLTVACSIVFAWCGSVVQAYRYEQRVLAALPKGTMIAKDQTQFIVT